MKERYFTVKSKADGLKLDVLEVLPDPGVKVKGIVQIVHGMSEHKERYLHFMQFLADHGYACVCADHRGHGKSVKDEKDLGYFYEEKADAIVNDLNDVIGSLRFEYPHVPVYMLGHSMGSLIVRKYLKQNDDRIKKLVISGAVYENPGAKPGKTLVKALTKLKGGQHHSDLVANMASNFDKGIEGNKKNRWLSENEENVDNFNQDPLSGFTFSLNGYQNLFQLIEDVYNKEGWQMKNPKLPIFFVAGAEDPVIGGKDNFKKTVQSLKDKGYFNVQSKLYPHMRHEILNETNRMEVYEDILKFLEE